MSNILEANDNYPFDKLTLNNPRRTQGGAAFCGLFVGENEVYVQLPKCSTKNGIHKSGNKQYIDLLFTENDSNFIEWYQTMEEHLIKKLHENREEWFDGDLDLDDIEYNWQSGIRRYKKRNYLLRAYIPNNKKGKGMKIWNEHQKECNLEYLDESSKVICILEFSGVKISQTFNLDVQIRQIMIFKDIPLMNKCLINVGQNKHTAQSKQNDLVSVSLVKNITTPIEENIESETMQPMEYLSNKNEANELKESNNENNEEKIQNVDTDENADADEKVDTDENADANENVNTNENNTNTEDSVDDTNQESLEETENVSDNTDNQEHLVENENNEKEIVKNEGKLESIDLNDLNILSDEKKVKKLELQDRQSVYIKMYKDALEKARDIKKKAIKQYLEAKKIKKLYLLEDVEDSSDDELDYLSD